MPVGLFVAASCVVAFHSSYELRNDLWRGVVVSLIRATFGLLGLLRLTFIELGNVFPADVLSNRIASSLPRIGLARLCSRAGGNGSRRFVNLFNRDLTLSHSPVTCGGAAEGPRRSLLVDWDSADDR